MQVRLLKFDEVLAKRDELWLRCSDLRRRLLDEKEEIGLSRIEKAEIAEQIEKGMLERIVLRAGKESLWKMLEQISATRAEWMRKKGDDLQSKINL